MKRSTKTICCFFLFVGYAAAHDNLIPAAPGNVIPAAPGNITPAAPGQGNILDITVKFGAKPEGDATAALMAAWAEGCACTVPTTILVPKGTFLVTNLDITGPCKNPITIRIDGILKAPEDPELMKKTHEWLCIKNIDGLTITGCGTLDGQGGKKAWAMNNYAKSKSFPQLPNNLNLAFLTNALIEGITTLDSKLFHVIVFGCKNITFQHFKICAPDQSPNTDGIHISKSAGVRIIESQIGTGDDCISIGDGTSQLHIEKVTCGPGHGISIGSLGKYPKEEPVCGVLVKNCTFLGSDNGVRIKSFSNLEVCSVTDVKFEDIIMNNVGNPILIDQNYCPTVGGCNADSASKVPISKVSYRNIKGTSRTKETIKLMCSKLHPCEGIEIADVDLVHTGPDGPAISTCANVKPIIIGQVNPCACASPAIPAAGTAAKKPGGDL